MTFKLHELVAATHTPFHADGSINLPTIDVQAQKLHVDGVRTVFVCGTTGEYSSLTLDERLAVAKRWTEVARGTPLRVVVHVGSNCLADSRTLAAHAQSIGAAAISALAPTYFKPKTVDDVVACCRAIAEAAPALPFYYYDIPSLTGVTLSPAAFLDAAAGRIPTLAGIKFTNADMMAYQHCLRSHGGRFDIPWGVDEHLLGALALGARGAVGSTYNFAAPIYHRLMAAFANSDLAAARDEQYRSVQLITLLISYGYMAAAKAFMTIRGVPVGPPRLPNGSLTDIQFGKLRDDLAKLDLPGTGA